ncbi:Swi3-domain-containing protein [Pilatotrama ljubarskyi]|nr:Swi3-domain-containing protein [Pilatotrama ljubarskyi]
MASLDDIWDEPAQSSSRQKSPSAPPTHSHGGDVSPPPAKRPSSSRPLFYDSDSGDDAPSASNTRYASKHASNRPDIDAFFADLDDDPDTAFQDLAPSLDVAALKRQADAKLALTPHQILPSSSPPRDLGDEEKGGAKGKAGDKDKKGAPVKKKKRPVLDEARLVGPDGFPALVKQAKDFKPKGKGHELQDLNRLMNVYQFWTHKMYPNTQFIDTVQRVEKLCHSKRMHVALSVWRDEAHGLLNGRKVPGPDDPLDSDSDADSDNDANAPKKPRARTQDPQDIPIATEDERSSPARSSPGRGATLPPSSPSSGRDSSLGALDDDFDIDAMIREDEAARAQAASTSTSGGGAQARGTYGAPRDAAPSAAEVDEDEAMWDAVMDDFPDEPYVPSSRPHEPAPVPAAGQRSGGGGGGGGVEEDMDEDMWDMVREMDTDAPSVPVPKPAAPSAPAPAAGPGAAQTGGAGEASGGLTLAGVDPSRKATNDEGWDEMYA